MRRFNLADNGVVTGTVKKAILDFLNNINEIRDSEEKKLAVKIEEVRRSLISNAKSSYSTNDVNNIFDSVKSLLIEELNGLTQNMGVTASGRIRRSIEDSLKLLGSAEVADYVDEIQKLREKLETLESAEPTVPEDFEKSLQEKIDSIKILEEKNSSLKSRLEELIDGANEKQEIIDTQRREIEKLQNDIQSVNSQLESLGNTMSENRLEIEEQQSYIAQKDEEIERLKVDLEQKTAQIRSAESQLKSFEGKVMADDQKGLIQNFQAELEAARAELADVRAKGLKPTRDCRKEADALLQY